MGFKNDNQRKAVMATLNNGASSRQSSKSILSMMEDKQVELAKARLIRPFRKDKWSEAEVNLALRRINSGKITPSEIFDNNKSLNDGDGIELEKSQQEKGLKWLREHTFNKKGDIKDSSSLREREAHVIKQNDVVISLQDFYSERGNFYVPMYNVSSEKAETSMDYVVIGGKVSILG